MFVTTTFRRCFSKEPQHSLLSGLSKTSQLSNTHSAKTFDVSAIDKLFTPPSSTGSGGKNRRIIGPTKEYAFTLEQLMQCRVHMGHVTEKWNPKMGRYILGERNGIHIINLEYTWTHLRRALRVIREMVALDGFVLWLPPKRNELASVARKIAEQGEAFMLDGRWIPGTLTNPLGSGQAKKFRYKLPDMLFCLDCRFHTVALKEAQMTGVPSVGIVDTDCDPGQVTYPIPGNDESALAISLYCQLVVHAVGEGRSLSKGRMEIKPNRPRQPPNTSRLLTPTTF
ncbi:30S ribosomal protein S2 (plastid) isoform 2 [Galdieria sulphuraria]|uniref:30S ribosomal protein S2 (Plastid) isoform 2 n=1 Tax=Galdieria sulphuraria TaxID=130081 RepID=M2XFE5_GALSU|nr:30S ribosomal protein S2 (plastid) isoform 2 [Galdieria sulphuraria]EME28727.1 30S ribosomal protein S2 (plastid) isoform 2 [Galdieria sulphuraria]|eukprot:XP_005705247.1 30S ribosomal protein S2 (plastid) isoform 2 [Galdieria sulphuraria]